MQVKLPVIGFCHEEITDTVYSICNVSRANLFFCRSGEHSNPVEYRFHFILEPVRDMVPGDRIERSVLLQNLSGQDLKYTVEKIK